VTESSIPRRGRAAGRDALRPLLRSIGAGESRGERERPRATRWQQVGAWLGVRVRTSDRMPRANRLLTSHVVRPERFELPTSRVPPGVSLGS
jgi:hypothetical protein